MMKKEAEMLLKEMSFEGEGRQKEEVKHDDDRKAPMITVTKESSEKDQDKEPSPNIAFSNSSDSSADLLLKKLKFLKYEVIHKPVSP